MTHSCKPQVNIRLFYRYFHLFYGVHFIYLGEKLANSYGMILVFTYPARLMEQGHVYVGSIKPFAISRKAVTLGMKK
jgi:hypothetical protein